MSQFIKLLPMELQQVETFYDPPDEVQKGEQVAGEMSESLKRLHALWMGYKQASEQHNLNYTYGHDKAELRLSARCRLVAIALEGIFWLSLNDEHELWEKKFTAIRKGWKVCWADRDESKGNALFRRLMEDLG